MKTTKATITTDPQQFEQLVELLGLLSEVNSRLLKLEAESNEQFMGVLSGKRGEYANYQSVLIEAERNIKTIASQHPEWFSLRKTLATPYGSVKHTSGTKLVTANEEMSVLLIEREAEANPKFKAEDYLRQSKVLNREALESLEDGRLARFGIKRERTEDYKITPAKVDLGKAVEAAVEREAA